MKNDLNRFLEAQERSFDQALHEIQARQKNGHWMWYIFPQLKGLGFSKMSKHYAINNLEEAKNYLDHPILGARLKQITFTLLEIEENNAHKIFGSPDDLKLKSCMTLFSIVDQSNDRLFQKILDKFFHGQPDKLTLSLIDK